MNEKTDDKPFAFGGPVVWQPTPDSIENANLRRCMRLLGSNGLVRMSAGQDRLGP